MPGTGLAAPRWKHASDERHGSKLRFTVRARRSVPHVTKRVTLADQIVTTPTVISRIHDRVNRDIVSEWSAPRYRGNARQRSRFTRLTLRVKRGPESKISITRSYGRTSNPHAPAVSPAPKRIRARQKCGDSHSKQNRENHARRNAGYIQAARPAASFVALGRTPPQRGFEMTPGNHEPFLMGVNIIKIGSHEDWLHLVFVQPPYLKRQCERIQKFYIRELSTLAATGMPGFFRYPDRDWHFYRTNNSLSPSLN